MTTPSPTICGTPFTIRFVLDHIADRTGVFNPKLKSHECTQIGIGNGYLSTVVRINLTWVDGSDPKLPKAVVLKVPTTASMDNARDARMEEAPQEMIEVGTKMRTLMHDFIPQAHNNECVAYNVFLKLSEPPLPLPYVYGTHKMASLVAPGALVMEDFSERKAVVVNKADGLTMGQVNSVVDGLATLYASSINNQLNVNHKYMNYTKFVESAIHCWKPIIAATLTPMAHYFGKISMDNLILSQAYCEAAFSTSGQIHSALNIPSGVVHGDVWTNNLLFGNGEESDTLLAAIDWQTSHIGNPMLDMARLLTSSISAKDRRDNEDLLIERFYTKCCSKLTTAPTFTVADLRRAYDFGMHSAVGIDLLSIGAMLTNPAITGEPNSDICKLRQHAMLERAAAALEDCGKVKHVIEKILG